MIVIECKDYKKPVDVKGVEEFSGLLDDVGAQKGVLVCPAGFSQTAKIRAEGLQIDLYSPVDTDPHKWTARAEVPTLCDFRAAAMSFGISMSAPYPFTMPRDFFASKTALDEDLREIGTPFETALTKWNDGLFPDEVGVHERIPIYETLGVLIDNGHGMNVPVDLSVSLWIKSQMFFGMLPINRMSGFKDEIRGGIITNAFEFGIISPEEIESHWEPLTAISDAPIKPVLSIVGRVAWDINDSPRP